MNVKQPRFFAIVAAAGSGSRMSSNVPKQFQKLDNFSILSHTLTAIIESQIFDRITIAANIDSKDPLFQKTRENIRHKLEYCEGGKTRMESVFNALTQVLTNADETDWVFVHDGARPGITPQSILNAKSHLEVKNPDGLIFAEPLVDSIKLVSEEGFIEQSLAREKIWKAQTPQCFRLKSLWNAINNLLNSDEDLSCYTDESACMEKFGIKADVFKGHSDNFKVTFAEDFEKMKIVINQQIQQGMRENPEKYFIV